MCVLKSTAWCFGGGGSVFARLLLARQSTCCVSCLYPLLTCSFRHHHFHLGHSQCFTHLLNTHTNELWTYLHQYRDVQLPSLSFGVSLPTSLLSSVHGSGRIECFGAYYPSDYTPTLAPLQLSNAHLDPYGYLKISKHIGKTSTIKCIHAERIYVGEITLI